MRLSLFSHLLTAERYRRQQGAEAGHALPIMLETQLPGPSAAPLLVSNMTGTFLRSKPSSTGIARYAFFECPLTQEPEVFARLLANVEEHWGFQNSVVAAVERVKSAGLTPGVVVSQSAAPATELPVLVEDTLPKGTLVVIAKGAGVYTRVGDHIGLLLRKVDSSVVVVHE